MKMNLSVENIMIVILLVVLIVLSVLYLTDNKPEGFSAPSGGAPGRHTLVFYHATWCGHCKRFMPTFNRLSDHIRDTGMPVDIEKVDCSRPDAALRQRLSAEGVRGYPTIKFNGNELNTRDFDELLAHITGAIARGQ